MPWSLKKIGYRIFQFFLTRILSLAPWRQPALLEGPGAVVRLPALIKSKGIHKVLVVTGGTISRLGLLNPMLSACQAAGLAFALFDRTEANPSIETIETARKLYLDENCQGIIAFGGGSPMDCAKAVGARIAKPRQSVAQMGGTLRVRKQLPPLFAVPTTAGTGSETTIAAVITHRSTHHKYAIQDPCLIPCCAVLDPELTLGLPPHITSTTGMDALTHALEAYTNRMGSRYTNRLAEEAIHLIFDNLVKAYRDGSDRTARQNLLKASFYGGAVINRACVGNVHAIAHTLGGLYGTPHGLANAVILPYVMEDYGSAVYRKLARLADIVGICGQTDQEKAKAFIQQIRQMNRDMNILDRFDFIEASDIPQMICWAMKEANPVYPVPVIWGEAEFARAISQIRT